MKKNRNSSIELLRIFAILLIIVHHVSLHGNTIKNTEGLNLFISSFMISGGKIGAHLFFMITGYFMIDNEEYPTKTLVKTFTTIFQYVLILFLIATFTGYKQLTQFIQVLNVMFPINSKRYWFTSAYMCAIIIFPVFTKVIKKLSFKGSLSILVVFGLFFVLFPAILDRDPVMDGNVLMALYLMYIGAYLKLYPPTMKPIVYFIMAFIMYSFIAYMTYLNINQKFIESTDFFWQISSPFALLCSIWIFSFFITLKPFTNRFINELGASTLGIYLLHDSQYRAFIWKNLFHVSNYYKSSKLFFHYGKWALVIIVVCFVIDRIRYYLLQRPFEKSKLFEMICNKINSISFINEYNSLSTGNYESENEG